MGFITSDFVKDSDSGASDTRSGGIGFYYKKDSFWTSIKATSDNAGISSGNGTTRSYLTMGPSYIGIGSGKSDGGSGYSGNIRFRAASISFTECKNIEGIYARFK